MPNKLQEYIAQSELRVVNDHFRVRLSGELAKKYDAGAYSNAIKRHVQYINEINALGIKYPGNAHPIFYMYIVPDDNFIELLSYPFPNATGGGRPVSIYDLDGFSAAYGLSQNILENKPDTPQDIPHQVNNIHEFAHLVHGQFFRGDRILSEGFAETLPLYTMDYEAQFAEHRAIIANMKPNDIISVSDMINMCREKTFGRETRIPNKTCSFDWSYISAYLFVRGYITRLAQIHNLDRIAATQLFLETVRASQYSSEWLFMDLGHAIDMAPDEILDGKELQLLAQSDIAKI